MVDLEKCLADFFFIVFDKKLSCVIKIQTQEEYGDFVKFLEPIKAVGFIGNYSITDNKSCGFPTALKLFIDFNPGRMKLNVVPTQEVCDAISISAFFEKVTDVLKLEL